MLSIDFIAVPTRLPMAPVTALTRAQMRQRFEEVNARPQLLALVPITGERWEQEVQLPPPLTGRSGVVRVLAFGEGRPHVACWTTSQANEIVSPERGD